MAADRNMMLAELPLRNFLSAFLPVLGSFVSSRLLMQTDIVMVAPLGVDAVAAYAVPSRVMIIDAIFAFALMPIVGIQVSRARSNEDKYRAARGALGVTLVAGIALAAVGFVLYPPFVSAVVKDPGVFPLALDAVYWMTATIPVRMLVAVATSCVVALGSTRKLKYLYATTVVLNAALNWLLIYQMGIGFLGSYLSTSIVCALECIAILAAVSRQIGGMPIGTFRMSSIRTIVKELGGEWFRLLSLQAEGVVLLGLFAINAAWTPQMAVFSVATSVTALLTMPLIAAMRATSISISKESAARAMRPAQLSTRRIALLVSVGCVAIGLSFLVFGFTIGSLLYRFSTEQTIWWQAYVVCLSLSLPISGRCAIKRGILQADGKYGLIAKCDLVASWCWCLPGAILALYLASPWLFFFSVVGKDVVAYCGLSLGSRRTAVSVVPVIG